MYIFNFFAFSFFLKRKVANTIKTGKKCKINEPFILHQTGEGAAQNARQGEKRK